MAVKGGNAVTAAEASKLPVNAWLHLVGVYEPGTAIRMYVNGALAAQNTRDIPGTQHNSDWNVTMGSGPDPNLRCYFRGIIDEVCIYERALIGDEIALIYDSVRAVQRQGQ